MTKTATIILIGAGVIMAGGFILYVFSKDAARKKAYNTMVPPEYAQQIIREMQEKK